VHRLQVCVEDVDAFQKEGASPEEDRKTLVSVTTVWSPQLSKVRVNSQVQRYCRRNPILNCYTSVALIGSLSGVLIPLAGFAAALPVSSWRLPVSRK
jgi:hypothetical protein